MNGYVDYIWIDHDDTYYACHWDDNERLVKAIGPFGAESEAMAEAMKYAGTNNLHYAGEGMSNSHLEPGQTRFGKSEDEEQDDDRFEVIMAARSLGYDEGWWHGLAAGLIAGCICTAIALAILFSFPL